MHMYVCVYIYIYIYIWSPPPNKYLHFCSRILGKYSEYETLIFTILLAIVVKAWWTNFKTHNEHMHI